MWWFWFGIPTIIGEALGFLFILAKVTVIAVWWILKILLFLLILPFAIIIDIADTDRKSIGSNNRRSF